MTKLIKKTHFLKEINNMIVLSHRTYIKEDFLKQRYMPKLVAITYI